MGDDERFTGYGVMGVPFRSGHVLCLRSFPVTSIGRGYASVWHRDPGGCWTFIQDVPPQNVCSRYFGSAVDRSLVQDIRIEWSSPWSFSVDTRGEHPVHWQVKPGHTNCLPAIAQLDAWPLRLSKNLDFHRLFICCKNQHFNLLIILCLIKLSIMLVILLTRTIISLKAIDHPASTITE